MLCSSVGASRARNALGQRLRRPGRPPRHAGTGYASPDVDPRRTRRSSPRAASHRRRALPLAMSAAVARQPGCAVETWATRPPPKKPRYGAPCVKSRYCGGQRKIARADHPAQAADRRTRRRSPCARRSLFSAQIRRGKLISPGSSRWFTPWRAKRGWHLAPAQPASDQGRGRRAKGCAEVLPVWGDMSSGIAARPDPPMIPIMLAPPKVPLRPLAKHERCLNANCSNSRGTK